MTAEAAQKGAGSKEVKPRRHWVISFVVGILVALFICWSANSDPMWGSAALSVLRTPSF